MGGGRNAWACGWQSEKVKNRVQELQRSAAVYPALASVSVQGGDGDTLSAQGPGAGHAQSMALEAMEALGQSGASKLEISINTHTCIRIWGDRPFQVEEDNDAKAKAHWRSVCDLQRPEDPHEDSGTKGDPASRILSCIKTLNPGHGPGLPSHLPVSIDTMATESIAKVTTGHSFMLFLTETGKVFSLGVGNHGELGLGEKVTMVRSPVQVEFVNMRLIEEDPKFHELPRFRAPTIESSTSYMDINLTKISVANPVTLPPLQPIVEDSEEEHIATFIVDIACGKEHAMALDNTGKVWLWGSHQNSGMGILADLYRPCVLNEEYILVPEVRLTGREITEFSIPPASSCVKVIGAGKTVSAIITDSGRLLMWGIMPGGHLSRYPELISIFTKNAEPVKKMEFGVSYGVLLSSAGNIYQLGTGTMGESLDRNIAQRSAVRKNDLLKKEQSPPSSRRGSVASVNPDMQRPSVLQMVPPHLTHLVPEFLSGLVDAYGEDVKPLTDVSVGDHHTLLLAEDGAVYAYGNNHWGQCGVGPKMTAVHLPTFVNLVAGSKQFVKASIISAGGRQSGVISTQNRAYLWGCSGNYRLIADAVREFVEYPLTALSSGNDNILSKTPTSKLGVSTAAGTNNSKFLPQSVPALAPFRISLLSLGWSYTVVITGKPNPPATRPSSMEQAIASAHLGSRHYAEASSENTETSRSSAPDEKPYPYTHSPVSIEGSNSANMPVGDGSTSLENGSSASPEYGGSRNLSPDLR